MKKVFFLLSLAIILNSCNTNDSGCVKKITVVSYGGGTYHESHVKAFINPYQRFTGIEVEPIVWNADYGKLKTMVESGQVPWDVVEVTDAEFKRGKEEHLFQALQLKPSNETFFENTIDSFGVANVYWGTVLAFKKSSFPTKEPQSWKDFWDIKTFKGKRALCDDPRGNLEFALLADGVPKEKLYPLDVNRAFKKLNELKPFIEVWWKDGTQAVQLLKDNAVDITSAWSGRIYALGSNNKDLKYTWNGGALELDWWVIPKGCKKDTTASRFICFASVPYFMAKQAELIGYGPVNKEALQYVVDSVKVQLSTYKQNWDCAFVIDSKWWAANEVEMMKKWIEWKSNK
jgi:putative spermidine/putrescine transport system substrate-binding protein